MTTTQEILKYTGTIDHVEEAEKGPHLIVFKNDDPNSQYDGKRFRCWGKSYNEPNPDWEQAKAHVGQEVEVSYFIDNYKTKAGEPRKKNMVTQVLPVGSGGDWGVPSKAPESAPKPRTDVRPTSGLEPLLAVIEASVQDVLNVVGEIRKQGAVSAVDPNGYIAAAEADGFTDKAVNNKLKALFPFRDDYRNATEPELVAVAEALGFTWGAS